MNTKFLPPSMPRNLIKVFGGWVVVVVVVVGGGVKSFLCQTQLLS